MEVRKDYILDRWVYFASDRAKRPHDFRSEVYQKLSKSCPFCPGNEKQTPKEIGRVEENGKWIIRWFNNKFPAVEKKGSAKIKTKNILKHTSAYGEHEVIVECRDHNMQLWDLDVEHLKKILDVYKERIDTLSKRKNIKYAMVFKNHGKDSGTSLIHSHTQITSLTQVPSYVKEEADAVKGKKCPHCKIIELEKKSKRLCFENSSFIAFAPYASRYNYEIWFFPKRHVKNMTELEDYEIRDLSRVLHRALRRLKSLGCSYNFFLHYAPKGSNLHFHIELTPRIATWGGFEIATNYVINSVLPEKAARFYRG